jgi:glutathione S-transferase
MRDPESTELILHHYDISPYAEKIRLIMGYKGLAWKSVQIPMIMPKPDLTCLTGGYRKTPVLQIGADIYCDTKTIARALERVRPAPTLYPPHTEASEHALSSMADAMFMMAVVTLLGAGFFPKEFIEDRQKMISGNFEPSKAEKAVPSKLDQLRASLAALEMQFADGRVYALGDTISLADFSLYNPISFLPLAPVTGALLEPFKHVGAWRDRMAAIGHGSRSEISAEEAIASARDATPSVATGVMPGEPNGYRAGERVTVMPEDYGLDPVTGDLVAADAFEVAIRRTDSRAGELVVHFPRQGYLISRLD